RVGAKGIDVDIVGMGSGDTTRVDSLVGRAAAARDSIQTVDGRGSEGNVIGGGCRSVRGPKRNRDRAGTVGGIRSRMVNARARPSRTDCRVARDFVLRPISRGTSW